MTIHLQLLSFPWSTTVFREDLVRTKTVKNMSSLRSITTFPPWRSFQVPRHWLFFQCCHSNPIVYESLVPDFFCHRLASYNQVIRLYYFFVCSFICLSGDFLFAYSSICFLVHLFAYLLIYSFAYMCFRLSCSAKYNSGWKPFFPYFSAWRQ